MPTRQKPWEWGLYMQGSYRRSLWSASVLVVIDLEPLSFVT
jgi:hypothetical protein